MIGLLEISYGSPAEVWHWWIFVDKSLYCQPEVCVRVNGKQSKSLHVGVGVQQGCALTPALFITYMNWMDKLSRTNECITIGRCKIRLLLFEDDLVLLASSESGL